MRMRILQITLSLLVVIAATTVARGTQLAQAASDEMPTLSHCYPCLHNATEAKGPIVARGGWGYINWTNPPLNGGQWSYHRVITAQYSPWKYVEFGWQKHWLWGLRGLIVWDDGSRHEQAVSVSAATHRYSMQHDIATNKYHFFLDGSNVFNTNPGFIFADYVIAGGETTGVESMYSTYMSDLRWLKETSPGVWQFASWNGHTDWVDHAPYTNINGSGSNDFYNVGN